MFFFLYFDNIFVKLLILLPVMLSTAEAADKAILEVIANGHNAGQHFCYLTEDDDVLVTPDLLSDLNLRKKLWKKTDKNLISLRSLSHALRFQMDHNNAVLTLAVVPEWFEPQTLNSKPCKIVLKALSVVPEGVEPQSIKKEPPAVSKLDNPASFLPSSAFLNYQIEAEYSEEKGFNGYNLPFEIGANWEKWFALSTFKFRYSDEGSNLTRLMTQIIRDEPEKLNRLILGDFSPPATAFLNGGTLCGVFWGTRFSLNRKFRPYPGLNLETVLETPAHAELYSGGHLVKEWDLLPGPVSFKDMEAYAGGNAELVLRDVFGRERRLDLPAMFGGQQLLREGVHEYAYSLGFTREDFGTESNHYNDLTAIAFHRYGFGDRITAGLGVAFKGETVNIGPMLAFRFGKNHQIDCEAMFSHDQGENGYALSALYSYRKGTFSGFLSLRHYSEDFAAPSSFNEDSSLRTYWNLSVNQSWNKWGGLSLSYSGADYPDDVEKTASRLSLTYNKNLFKQITMSVRVLLDLSRSTENEVFFGLQYTPDDERKRRLFDNASYSFRDTEKEESRQEFRMQKYAGTGKGLGYNLSLSQDGKDTGGSGRVEYRHELGVLETSVQCLPDGSTSGRLNAAGGIGLIDKGLYFGRPVTDSFAAVEVEGLEQVPIYANYSLAGNTGKDGTLFVPNLTSYQENQINIRPKDLPVNYELREREKYIEIGQRGGARISFKAYKYSSVEGNLFLVLPDGKRDVLSTLALEIEVAGGEKRSAFTGQDGYFYLENLPAGTHLLRVHTDKGDYEARLIVPESDKNKIVTHIGDVLCEPVLSEYGG